MYAKYRIYLATTSGGFVMAVSNRADSLPGKVLEWLENTSQGRSLEDDQVNKVILYMFDPDKGHYVFGESVAANSREDVVTKAKELTQI